MSKHVSVRLVPNPFLPDSVPCPAPVLDAAAKRASVGESQLSIDPTLHARSLWGQLIIKVARVQRKENNQ
jgi:hypothetical protein